MAVYMNNLSFSHYKKKYVKDHLHYLSPSNVKAYIPPDAQQLSGHMLNELNMPDTKHMLGL